MTVTKYIVPCSNFYLQLVQIFYRISWKISWSNTVWDWQTNRVLLKWNIPTEITVGGKKRVRLYQYLRGGASQGFYFWWFLSDIRIGGCCGSKKMGRFDNCVTFFAECVHFTTGGGERDVELCFNPILKAYGSWPDQTMYCFSCWRSTWNSLFFLE